MMPKNLKFLKPIQNRCHYLMYFILSLHINKIIGTITNTHPNEKNFEHVARSFNAKFMQNAFEMSGSEKKTHHNLKESNFYKIPEDFEGLAHIHD